MLGVAGQIADMDILLDIRQNGNFTMLGYLWLLIVSCLAFATMAARSACLIFIDCMLLTMEAVVFMFSVKLKHSSTIIIECF